MTIEAVNSVIANSAVVRGGTNPIDSARAAQTDSLRSGDGVSLQTPYRSLNVSIDQNYDRAVLQIRDSQTGDVLDQYPSDTRLRAQNAAQSGVQSSTLSETNQGQSVQFEVQTSDTVSVDVARAQVAAQALSTAAQAGVESLSAGVSVSA